MQSLAVAERVCTVVGTFLIGLQLFVGVEKALQWILRVRAAFRRRIDRLLPKRGFILGFGGSEDVKKSFERGDIDLQPYVFVTAAVVFSFGALFFYGATALGPLTSVHAHITELGTWRYVLHPLAGILEAVILIVIFLIGTFVFYLLLTIGLCLSLIALILILSIPVYILRFFVLGKAEKKIAWLGLLIVIIGQSLIFFSH